MHTRVVYYELILLAGSSMHTRLAVGFGTLNRINKRVDDVSYTNTVPIHKSNTSSYIP